MDMEFVQFHPSGIVSPPSVRGLLIRKAYGARVETEKQPGPRGYL